MSEISAVSEISAGFAFSAGFGASAVTGGVEPVSGIPSPTRGTNRKRIPRAPMRASRRSSNTAVPLAGFSLNRSRNTASAKSSCKTSPSRETGFAAFTTTHAPGFSLRSSTTSAQISVTSERVSPSAPDSAAGGAVGVVDGAGGAGCARGAGDASAVGRTSGSGTGATTGGCVALG